MTPARIEFIIDELILHGDATHIPLRGQQERAHFHAHYDNYCYLPL